ncbi:hypothetical protein BH10BDE1_BH10BDE1_24680 [soil metagenome]
MKSKIRSMFYSVMIATAILFFFVAPAQAGFVEIGGSGSYKKSNIGTDSFDESQSLTASFSYYFDESSALELSYTDGISRRVIGQTQPDGQLTNMYYKMVGLDLVLTLGEREATFRPYVKVGGVYIMDKRIVTQYWSGGNVFPENTRQDPAALVPSAGVGFKISLTKSWSLKVGAEAWSSRSISEQPVTVDYSGRVGLSCMF